MQVACPSCAATYQVPDAMIGEGRQIRCVRCGDSWFATASRPDAAPDVIETPTPLVPPRVETAAPLVEPDLPNPVRRPPGLLPLAWIGSLAVWAGGLYVLWVGRTILTDLWPPIARLYLLLGPA